MYSLLNETRNCQVCKKSFPNGRALGGHMRSHTRTLSASNGSTVPSLKTPTKLGENIRLNETVLMRSVHASEVGRPEPDLKREEGGQQITCKRKIVVDLDECQSPLTAVEEAALVIVAMSKGERPANSQNWNAIDRLLSTPNEKEEYTRKSIDIDSDDDGRVLTEGIDENEDGDEDEEDETYLVEKEKQCKKRFTCDICGKVLHSYQALGGHRTSHRTKRLKICDKNGQAMVRHYKCELCGRVFESGQALGGHKKVHYAFL
ncbi:zinc finger protein ZAT1 [Raphanus sativus]|uniref:Zinc finger protein ZAT1 n=1 Tax=Raphanus sativus TaxID=3726 RepID=A0A6J0N5U7_RAPSA|nr:zinc finger protein ZAT1 [Raphanus sativus]